MQHGAGYIVFENIRKSAISKIPPEADNTLRDAHLAAIDNTIYGMMMQMDGIFGSLENENYRLICKPILSFIKMAKWLKDSNTLEGDGMCMGFHGWIENDFGSYEIVTHIELKK